MVNQLNQLKINFETFETVINLHDDTSIYSVKERLKATGSIWTPEEDAQRRVGVSDRLTH